MASEGPSPRADRPEGAAARLWRSSRLVVLGIALIFSLSASVSGTNLIDRCSPRRDPLGQDGEWSLVFSDEFEGASLDVEKWHPAFPWGNNSTTTPDLLYETENVVVSEGTLKLRALRRTEGAPAYSSGIVTTANSWGDPYRFTFTYGYVEMRARVPAGAGLWPALWLLPPQGRWTSEIDVVEILGSAPTVAEMHYHYIDSEGVRRDDGMNYQGPDFSADFHTFAVDWSPEAIRWFIDGVEARPAFTSAEQITDDPMYLIANLQVGGEWAGDPSPDTVFPAELEIDYIRVWQSR